MQTHKESVFFHPHNDDPHHDPPPKLVGEISLPTTDEDSVVSRAWKVEHVLAAGAKWVFIVLNPPLVGGILAVFLGLIPFFHHALFAPDGFLTA